MRPKAVTDYRPAIKESVAEIVWKLNHNVRVRSHPVALPKPLAGPGGAISQFADTIEQILEQNAETPKT